ncbi:TRAP transporter substrate-binding protein [Cytobacillus oceanisediminis]|uniref:Tripartite ATP-independent transporter DctP family solute receptor n=1 Tax=Cytobacillus oceanisediminis TaxID=665099 RepID=A0A562J4I6_9BACI|nr:TRAP transporter substrate-binding protein [Cytobacillus oceanisediminis]TWH77825.1 tripartite ATP-independent transporter DctP family solute receptor [Cytobacillus oceanisediminis]
MRRISILLTVFVLILALAGCQNGTSQSGVSELKLAHNQTLDHPVHLSLVEFGRIVKEKSNNKIQVKIYPNGQLGSEREVLELTQSGAVDVAKVSASALEGFEPDYSIFSLPYVFEDYEEFEKTMNNKDITDKIYYQTEDIGIIGLTYYNAGVRNLYTKNREVNTVADMKGLKTRVQPSQTSVNMIEALGGLPTPMAYGEVYTALQSGVIDAAENNETALVGNNHGEVAKYYMYTGHQIVPDMLVMNAKRFNKFSAEEQKIIQEAAEESTLYHEGVWAKTINEMTETAKNEMGVKFIEVDKSSFIEAVQPLHKAYAQDEKTRDIYQIIKGAGTNE